MGYQCERCGHEWIPRGDLAEEPRVCPKCKSPYWNQPRVRGSATTYENFRSRVRSELEKAAEGLTWTEIRMAAKLPQSFPNNQWVRRLEADIGLKREREGGAILWRIEDTKE